MRNTQMPELFLGLDLPSVHTEDGFWMSKKPLANILQEKEIFTFPNDQGQERECGLFYDDWHLYGIDSPEGWVYSLVKLREQEYDKQEGRIADGDTPGVTVSFIAFEAEALLRCLENPSFENRQAMNREINRVVSFRRQRHHRLLKAYFEKTESQGPYLIAEAYVKKIASLAKDGRIPVPCDYKKARKGSRLPRFIEKNNKEAGTVVCDHETIFVRNAQDPTVFEKLAIMATHTANVSFPSFAAEVQFHACFLVPPARITLPFLGHSLYESAIRADMTIDSGELEWPAPFYDLNGRMVRRQKLCHPEYANT